MCKLAKEGEGRRKRATGRGESGCNKRVASGRDSVLISQVLASDAVLEAACACSRWRASAAPRCAPWAPRWALFAARCNEYVSA